MRHSHIKLVAVLFTALVMITGCNKDNPVEPEQITINISGDWKGHLLLDGLGNEITSDSTFLLNVNQNNNLLILL